MKKLCLSTALQLVLLSFALGQSPLYKDTAQQAWVDSVYNTLTFEQQIGQLFMVAAYPKEDSAQVAQIEKYIRENAIGGLIFYRGTPAVQVALVNRYQKLSKVPLLIGMDAEWGLNMRLDSTLRYPWAMTLGAVQDVGLLRTMGKQVAQQCRRMGIQLNFAPDADVNTNPKNPVIGNRSFGDDPKAVADHALAYAKGMQQGGVLACAKHFPGHGDTDVDSHKALPVVSRSLAHLDKVELPPFERLIHEGVTAVMTAHLYVPALTAKDTLPASVSKNVVTKLLRDTLAFKGLIISDALNMKGVADLFKPGFTALKAFQAGNDILLFPRDLGLAIALIKNQIAAGKLSYSRLQQSVKRVLRAKYWAGLNRWKPLERAHLIADLNRKAYRNLERKLFEKAITVLRNRGAVLPINPLAKTKIAYVPLGEESGAPFLTYLKRYAPVDRVDFLKNPGLAMTELEKYDLVIIGVHKSDQSPYESHVLSEETNGVIREISAQKRTLLDIFASPYSLLTLTPRAQVSSIVMSYQNDEAAQRASAAVIFGALGANGRLPVSIDGEFNAKNSIRYPPLKRLSQQAPGLSSPMSRQGGG